MKTRSVWMFVVIVTVLVGVVGTVRAQSETDAMEEASRKLDEMVAEVNAFVGDVRFDEGDVEHLIELWPEFDQLGSLVDDDDDEESLDLDAVVADPEYRAWAASHGLDADDWLRTSTRITMTLYREQILQSTAMAPQQIEQQMQMIEQQRGQLGDEMYLEMKKTLEASAAYSRKTAETARQLPEATAAEKAALDKHRDELMALMMSDDDEEEYGYGYDGDDAYEDDYDYDYDYDYDDGSDNGGV